MERLVQSKPKLFDNGKIQVFYDEATNMELYVIERGGRWDKSYMIMGLDVDSGECDWLYVEQSEPGLWDTEEGELLDIAMLEAKSHKSVVNGNEHDKM